MSDLKPKLFSIVGKGACTTACQTYARWKGCKASAKVMWVERGRVTGVPIMSI